MKPVDEVLSERNNLKEELYNRIFKEAEEIGISLRSIDIKDISLGGELKKTFMKVVQPRRKPWLNWKGLEVRWQFLGVPGNTVMLNVATIY